MIHSTWIDKLKSSLHHDNWKDDDANKIVEALEKHQELADKYAAALGRVAFLEEQLKKVREAVGQIRWIMGETN